MQTNSVTIKIIVNLQLNEYSSMHDEVHDTEFASSVFFDFSK